MKHSLFGIRTLAIAAVAFVSGLLMFAGTASAAFLAHTDSTTANSTSTLGLIGTSATSSDATIATTSITGGGTTISITSVASGTATIIVTDDSDYTATIGVAVASSGAITIGTIAPNAVTINVTGISLDKISQALAVGNGYQLTATVTPEDAWDPTVNWSSSDEDVATVDSDGLIDAIDVGNATITAETVDGSFTATDYLTIDPEPTISSISPSSGPTAGGTEITITGTGFENDAEVSTLYGLLEIIASSSTEIITTTPATSSENIMPIFVINPYDGGIAFNLFTYDDTNPSFGAHIGTSTIITGATTTIGVTVNDNVSVASAEISFDDGDTWLPMTETAASALRNLAIQRRYTYNEYVPEGSPDIDYEVQAFDTAGNSATLNDTLIILPSISDISPPSGATIGGTSITITGTGFVDGADVTIGGVEATDIVVASSTEITATTPVGTVGPADVIITNSDDGSVDALSAFTYTDSEVEAAKITAETLGTIHIGDSVLDKAQVLVDDEYAVSITGGTADDTYIDDSGTAIAASGGETGTIGFTVTTITPSEDTADTGVLDISVISTPVIDTISPSFGPASGGTAITIIGTGFLGGEGDDVTIGGTEATNIDFVSDTEITATTPAGAGGPANVVVANYDGGRTTSVGGFSYLSGGHHAAVTSVSLNETSRTLTVGNTDQLTATVVPSNATNQTVNWSSSNSSVATVSATGLITVVGAGSATITATTADGGYTATDVLTVNSASTVVSGGGGGGGGSPVVTTTPTNTSALTQAQISAIVALLQSFGADAETVANIQAILSGQATPVSSATVSAYIFTSDLTIGSKGTAVVALQQILVKEGYLVMPAGVAEGYFGTLTQAALAKFQVANGISPAAGYFGPKTRAFLNGK